MFVSVTRLRVRALRFVPGFALHSFRSLGQARKAHGFRGGTLLADRRWTFWTMTGWDSETAMRDYMAAGPHASAAPHLYDWCDEASVVHWEQPENILPPWADASRCMRQAGRASKVRHPSPNHQALTFAAPRLAARLPIRPIRSS